MNIQYIVLSIMLLTTFHSAFSQVSNSEKDSLLIYEPQEQKLPKKVLHAEPLYIDLIRDLGARKGEKEWNIGLGLTDNQQFDSYEALVEYEWAPVNRLGLEVELPFTFYSPNQSETNTVPAHRLNSLKMAAQWSFFVSESMATSMAIGYINEFELSDFENFGNPVVTGNSYNPFLVMAKRWGSNFHSLIYTGPKLAQHFSTQTVDFSYEINTSFHYMITGTRNFLGVEFNKEMQNQDFDMTIRPQMRVSIADHLMVGIVAGIPVSRENERLSSFVRLIWEPKHTKK